MMFIANFDANRSIIYMDKRKESGRRLKSARKRLGLSQADLGSIIGFTAAAIGNWEQGTNSIRPNVAKKISKALGVSAPYLLRIEGDSLDKDEQHLIDKYRATDDRGKDMIQGAATSAATTTKPSNITGISRNNK